MSQITILDYHQNIIFEGSSDYLSGKKIRDFLHEISIEVEAPCGGHGSCGKCTVGLQTGDGSMTLVQSCKALLPTEDCCIFLPESARICNSDFSDRLAKANDLIESEGYSSTRKADESFSFEARAGLGAAVDLGTTTIAVALLDLQNGKLLGKSSDWNCQGRYGADVISRAQYCMERMGGLRTLSSAIRKQIRRMIGMLAEECGHAFSEITEIVLAGNTIMQHIFAGIDPASITVAPYLPKSRFSEPLPLSCPEFPGIRVLLFPCVAGYVGGDITAGLFAAEDLLREGLNLFLDIGTNGEMALGSHAEFVSCSVASGPAFEGANISCGMRSMEGAINRVSFPTSDCLESTAPFAFMLPTYQVIGGGEAKGLCGSGLLDLTALLLHYGIIDETGRMLGPTELRTEADSSPDTFVRRSLAAFVSEDENENGTFHIGSPDSEICLTAEDVRQVQLAKAAVAAGIQVLLHHAGKCLSDVDHVYLAGGFGRYLNPESVCALGMIPKELKNRIVPLGNTSLAGAEKLLRHPNAFLQVKGIQEACKYIELSVDADFSDAFIDAMYF